MRVVVPLILLTLLACRAGAEDSSALINEALDKNITLSLNGILPDVLKTIEQQTGVRIVPTRNVYDLLPWGDQTNVKATIQNQTLREALTAITRKLGLAFDLGAFDVELKPMPALARLGRRATIAELQALDLLSVTPAALASERMTVQQLVDAVDAKLAAIKSPNLAIELRAGDPANPQYGLIKLDQPVDVPRNATLSDALEALVRQTNATWYPWGKNIVVVPKEEQVRMALNRKVSARFAGAEVADVLNKLEEWTGVRFNIEPGAIQRVPADYRTIRLDLDNAPVRQVLDRIRGVTGLDYVAKPDGVYIWNQNPNAAAGGGRANDPVVLTLEMDGGLQMFLRESDLPPDVRAYVAAKKQGEIGKLRKLMQQEGFNPATRPASQQADGQ